MLKGTIKYSFADGILLVALLLVGSFHEYISCALTVAMSIYLLVRLGRQKQLTIRKDLLTAAVMVLCLFYGVSCIWAVDRGMAFIGFLKFLPLGLYLLCLQQEQGQFRVLTLLPYFSAALAVISAVLMQIPACRSLFSVAGRLAGPFQYPNTFAVLLLVCQLLLLKKEHKKAADYLCMAALIAGLLYTGSRTAFVVAILANGAMLLSMTKKRVRLISLGIMGGICALCLLLALFPNSVLRRYLTISLTESTFVGRLLYWVDALPLLLRYPYGMGYMGYFYTQQSIQTGVYSVMYTHNDLLQLLLDVGFIPTGLFVAAVILWFCKKTVPTADKIIAGAVLLHSFFDFDLQFIGIFMLLLLLMSQQKTDKLLTVKAKLSHRLAAGAAAVVALYMGAALMLAHLQVRQLADTLYPYNTQNKLALLEQEADLEQANALADAILKQNAQFYAPYSIKARYHYSKGDFTSLIRYMHMTLEKNPFGQAEYDAYCQMLIKGISLYQKKGDTNSVKVCQQELRNAAAQLAGNADRLSALGKMIDDQPVLTLSQEVQQYLDKLKQ